MEGGREGTGGGPHHPAVVHRAFFAHLSELRGQQQEPWSQVPMCSAPVTVWPSQGHQPIGLTWVLPSNGHSWAAKASSFRARVSRKKSQKSPIHLRVGHRAPRASVPTGSVCFGVGCEWQRAQKKIDLKETDADFLINSSEAVLGWQAGSLIPRDPGSLCLVVPPLSIPHGPRWLLILQPSCPYSTQREGGSGKECSPSL